jgi:hypothetical protein
LNRKYASLVVLVLTLLSSSVAQEAGEQDLDQAALEAGAEAADGLDIQEPGLALGVELYAYPEVPQVHSTWIVALLVDYPVPEEIQVKHPPLPESLTLERIRTMPHRIRPSLEVGKVQTLVEFWFIPQKAGALSLGAFEVIAPDRHGFTEPGSWYIPGETPRVYSPICSWLKPPQSLRIGETGTLVLRLHDWDPRKPWPGTALFLNELPEGALLEAGALTAQDQEQGLVLRLEVIPLEGREFTLKPRYIAYEGLRIKVPELRIPLIPGAPAPAPSPQPADTPPLAARAGDFPFPHPAPPKGPWFRADYEAALQQIQDLWNQGKIPEALGEMRRNERENLAGPAFALLRREAEQVLGLSPAQNEPWRPRKVYLLLVGLGLGLLAQGLAALLVQRVYTKRLVTSRIPQGYKGMRLLMIMGTLLLLFALIVLGKPYRGTTRGQGVLRAAQAYRVPEEGGMVSASFRAGEAVQVYSASDDWVYVVSFEGRQGWVPRDTVIWY